MTHHLSVIIPTTGRRDDLALTLDAVLSTPGGAGDDTIVVIDGPESTPPTEHAVRWLWTGSQKGPACARNLGAASAEGDLLVFIDDDVHPDTEAFAALCGAIDAGADAACASVRPAPGVADNAYLRFAYGGAAHGGGDDGRDIWWHWCTSLAMVKRTVFERVNGFDERFPEAAYEDIDLAFRIQRGGGQLALCDDAIAWHRRGMDRNWFIAKGSRQGAQLARLVALQPALQARRHEIMKRMSPFAWLLTLCWHGGRAMLPVVERSPRPLASACLRGIHACGVSSSFLAACRCTLRVQG